MNYSIVVICCFLAVLCMGMYQASAADVPKSALNKHGYFGNKVLCKSPFRVTKIPAFPFNCQHFSVCGPPSVPYFQSKRDRARCCLGCKRRWLWCVCQGYARYYCWQKALTCICNCNKRYPCCREL